MVGEYISVFMTHDKPDWESHWVISDLSWPLGAPVNAGIDKTLYLDNSFPTNDDIMNELKVSGKDALLYNIEIGGAFPHVKVDPGDYNPLGLNWDSIYFYMCLLFGTQHRSQIFQSLSDAVHYVRHSRGLKIIDNIDEIYWRCNAKHCVSVF